jgi:hypothetical protein
MFQRVDKADTLRENDNTVYSILHFSSAVASTRFMSTDTHDASITPKHENDST